MLHDPSHNVPLPTAQEIKLTTGDKDILRQLAGQLAEIAVLPVHREKATLWQRLNDLESARPMVWINEVCWHEMNIGEELTLQCRHPWAREQEVGLRRTLYQWRHFPVDAIIGDYLPCPLAIHSSDFGMIEKVDVVKTDEASDIFSRRFHIQIEDYSDLEKIKMPVITHHEIATEFGYAAMNEIYADILPVKKVGQTHIWYTPWDWLIRWWGIEEAMLDLCERPDLVHAAVERMTDAWMTELDQLAAMNLLSLDCNNTRIGSGGYGYTRDLPGKDYHPSNVKPHNTWGCANAQIFSAVSPEMHWEFALRHDMRWLSRFGLTYYGCCEPLHHKIGLLRRIPNLRKISINYLCNLDRVAHDVGPDYVWSYKPNPAALAEDGWRPEQARAELVQVMERAEATGSHVEFIMKDISTVRYHPERLWDWARMAMEVAEAYPR